ncbi:putative cyclase-associated protein CAP/septum formation inhibitor MinC [Plasmopara halstedii]
MCPLCGGVGVDIVDEESDEGHESSDKQTESEAATSEILAAPSKLLPSDKLEEVSVPLFTVDAYKQKQRRMRGRIGDVFYATSENTFSQKMIFTASDGKKFEDRAAWRLYEFELTYTFRNKVNETLMKLPGQIDGQAFDVSDLEGCQVMLLDHINQVQIDHLSNCRVFVGPSSESVFVRNCTNCVFTIACKQLRTRDCSDCSIYLYSLTDPIIETSQEMTFAPFNGAYCGIERNFADARLEPTNNHWSQVYDFNDPDKSGDNWRILNREEETAPWIIDIESHIPDAATKLGPCVNPVARDSGFVQYTDSTSSVTGSMQSFTFSTSQKDAIKAMQTSTSGKLSTKAAPLESASSQSLPAVPSTTPLAPIGAPLILSSAEASFNASKEATMAMPEHVAPPPAMSSAEDSNLKGHGVDVDIERVAEMVGMMNIENPVRAATLRKWYARIWWLGVHVYGYVLLGVKGELSPQVLSTPRFVAYIIAAGATIICYGILQFSSPGHLNKRLMLAPVHATIPTEGSKSPHVVTEDRDDTELLGDEQENEHTRNSVDLHFCNECHVFQPLRTKHCKDCARCTRQYDHHCDCVGTCVGENNRRIFLLYLFLQIVEAIVMIQVTSQAFTEENNVNDWFKTNTLFIILWFFLMCVLLIVIPLLSFQVYLISTNQTSWEFSRRLSITYLQNLPDKRSPFDRGVLQNWGVFITKGDSNKWVHLSVAKPMTSHVDNASSLV